MLFHSNTASLSLRKTVYALCDGRHLFRWEPLFDQDNIARIYNMDGEEIGTVDQAQENLYGSMTWQEIYHTC